MKNKLRNIIDKINQALDKHDNFLSYIVILLVLSLFWMFAYWAYIAFTISPILGALTIIIELGLIVWYSN